jgi:F-type H+-transporting ATPase subunit delta
MRTSELAIRYARAAFNLAVEAKAQEKTFADLRALDVAFAREPEILQFFSSPLAQPEEKEAALKAALAGSGASETATKLLLTLAKKERLGLFAEIVRAFQDRADAVNGVGRGTVRSAVALAPQERQQIEAIVEKVLKKKVILTYKIDPSVIGGLVAQVGSFTFDDSIDSHLKRMTEELKRRTV